jgi:Zn-dependent peptidase ImmA (M78 family)
MEVQERGKTLTSSEFKEKLGSLVSYLQIHLGIKKLPTLKLSNNQQNASDMLGYTGHYSHDTNQIVAYIADRHPKDILRTIAHEIIHHWQNEHGQLYSHDNDPQYAQNDLHMRKMEEQAYLLGNILFRDWSDFYKHGNKDIHTQSEPNTRK